MTWCSTWMELRLQARPPSRNGGVGHPEAVANITLEIMDSSQTEEIVGAKKPLEKW